VSSEQRQPQARTTQMYRITPIVQKLLLLNIALFFMHSSLGLDLVDSLGLRCVLSDYFRPYQFFTHLFVHANLGHLGSNMFALLTFGPMLEQTLHAKKFILFYVITGLGAALLYAIIQYFEVSNLEELYYNYLVQPNPTSFVAYLKHFPRSTYSFFYPFISSFFEHSDDLSYIAKSQAIISQLYTLKADMPTVGASGSVFGIFMAFAMLFPNTALFLVFIPFPIKAKYVVAMYGVYELCAGIRSHPADNVAHFVHLGGIVFAYLFIRWWKQRHDD
jgi:membrane associated rhomboid family serine protease